MTRKVWNWLNAVIFVCIAMVVFFIRVYFPGKADDKIESASTNASHALILSADDTAEQPVMVWSNVPALVLRADGFLTPLVYKVDDEQWRTLVVAWGASVIETNIELWVYDTRQTGERKPGEVLMLLAIPGQR